MSLSAGPPELADGSITALVADAHVPTRIGFGVLLLRQPWVVRCLLAAKHEESVALVRRHRPDIAVLDISDAGPLVALMSEQVRDAHPAIKIVFSSRYASLPGGRSSVGAVTVLPCNATTEDILDAIRAALLSRDPPYRSPAREPRAGLTDRERKVLALLSTGATNREIAAQLHLGPDSVKKHATALYRKLGVRNRTEAAQRASRLAGII